MAEFTSANAISSKQAKAFITVNGQNHELFYAKSIEATLTKNKEEIRALGSRMVGHKTTSVQGEGTLTIYEITSMFKELFLKYVNEGVDVYFNLQITNEDPSTAHGRETKILTYCNFDEITIASFDTEDGVLEQELSFTFEGVELLEKFK